MPPTADNFQDTDEPGGGHLAALQRQLNAAMMTRKRGEARRILDQVISLSGSEDAKKNLNTLVTGVIAEARDFERDRGTIQERLSGDTDLQKIQSELDEKIPYWRAFVDDITCFRHAAEGLPAHDNPCIKAKVAELVKMISGGQVASAAVGWNKAGKPSGATSEVITGILNDLSHLEAQCATKKWTDAGKTLGRLQAVVDQESAKTCAPGLAAYLKNTGETVRCELLLERAATSPESKTGHTKLAEELQGLLTSMTARSVSGSTPGQRKMIERLEEMIEQVNSRAPENREKQGSGASKVIIASIFTAILVALLIVWKTQPGGDKNVPPPPPGNVNPPLPFDPAACGSEKEGDVRLRMPNRYYMIFRRINLGKAASIEITESDGNTGILRAPFVDDEGNHYFLMGKTEVSTGQFSQLMPLPQPAGNEASLPVNHVTDEDVMEFCKKYSIWLTDNESLPRSGNGRFGQCRLPSTAEWEFAARGADPLQRNLTILDRFSGYPAGENTDISQFEWFSGPLSSKGQRQPIETLDPNQAGLHDMLGNVSEMTTSGSTGNRKRRMQGGNFNIARSNITPALNLDRPALMPAISKAFRQEELGFRIVISTVAEWNEPQ